MEFRFADPRLLALLAVLPIMLLGALWDWRRRRRLLHLVIDENLAARLAPGREAWRYVLRSSLLLAAAAALAVAMARPQFGVEERREKARGVDLYILIDLSRSMLSPVDADLDPRNSPNRLQQAKTLLDRLVRDLSGDRVGLVVFSSEAYVFCPLTLDHSIALDFLQELQLDLVSAQGTDIGNALEVAIDAFDEVPSDADRALLLVTDGEDHGGRALEVAQRTAESGIRVYSLGLGSDRPVPIPIAGQGNLKDDKGLMVSSRLDMELLQQLAAATRGAAYHAAGRGIIEVESLSHDLRGLRQGEREEQVFRVGREQFPWLLGAALVLLLLEWLPLQTRREGRWLGRFR